MQTHGATLFFAQFLKFAVCPSLKMLRATEEVQAQTHGETLRATAKLLCVCTLEIVARSRIAAVEFRSTSATFVSNKFYQKTVAVLHTYLPV